MTPQTSNQTPLSLTDYKRFSKSRLYYSCALQQSRAKVELDLEMDSLTFSEVELFVAFTVIVLSTLALAFCRLCRRRKGEYTFQSWIESASTAQQHSKRSTHVMFQ